MLGDKRGHARAGASWRKGVWEMDRRCWGDRDSGPHLTPQAVPIPLEFLLRNGLQCDFACDVPTRRLGGGAPRGGEGDRGNGESWGGGRWVDGPAARRVDAQRESTVLVLRAMSRTAIHDEHDVKLVIYLQYRFRVYTPERLSVSHTHQDFFQTSQSRLTLRVSYWFFLVR